MSKRLPEKMKDAAAPVSAGKTLPAGPWPRRQTPALKEEEGRRHRQLAVRAAAAAGEFSEVPPIVHEVLRSPGQPLAPEVRAFMEPRFGHDFSRVQVHTDAKAAASAKAVKGLAYTVGPNIVFGSGRYQPGSTAGKRLIAHELAHTVEQSQGLSASPLQMPNHLSDEGEEAAERFAAAVLENRAAPMAQRHAFALQRQAEPGGLDLAKPASPFLAAAIGSVTIDGFETDKAEISKENENKLRETVKHIKVLLEQYPGSKVRVTGHTDAVGAESHNMELGEQRAAATREMLITMGVPGDIIETASKGETELLIKPSKGKPGGENEPRNRRVEVRFEPAVSHFAPLAPKLSLTPPAAAAPGPKINIPDLRYLPPIPKGPQKPALPPDFWKPLPPPIPGTEPKSVLDAINQTLVDPIVDAITKPLPENLRKKVKEAAHDAVKAGMAKGARAAAEAAGVTDPEKLEAIEKAVEAAIQEKGKRQP